VPVAMIPRARRRLPRGQVAVYASTVISPSTSGRRTCAKPFAAAHRTQEAERLRGRRALHDESLGKALTALKLPATPLTGRQASPLTNHCRTSLGRI